MKYVIGDTVKHKTGVVGKVSGVIRYKNGTIEYLVDYGKKCYWSVEQSLSKWQGVDYEQD